MAIRILMLCGLYLLNFSLFVAAQSESGLNTTTITVGSSDDVLIKPNRTGLVTESVSAGTYTITYAPYSTYTDIRILEEDELVETESSIESDTEEPAQNTLPGPTSTSTEDGPLSTVETVTITQTEVMVIVWPIGTTLTGSPAPTPGLYTVTVTPWSTYTGYRVVPYTVLVSGQPTSTIAPGDTISIPSATSSPSVTESEASITATPDVTDTITSAPSATTYTKSSTFRVDGQGTMWVMAMNGTTYATYTIVGPTTQVIYATQWENPDSGWNADFRAWSNPNDTACANAGSAGAAGTVMNDHTIKIKSVLSTLAAGESLSVDVPYSFNYTPVYSPTTFVGPTTAWVTDYRPLLYPEVGRLGLQPGLRCSGFCGPCYVLFESVSVHFWPVEAPVTQCLGNSTASTALEKRQVDSPTTVVVDGFTYTSPSVYVVIPTISARDNCGTLGQVHTQVTLSFAPEDVSTIVHLDAQYPSHRVDHPYLPVSYSSIYQPFDFRYAECPPPSLEGGHFWTVVADNGNYNPILAAPPKLTTLDPAWAQICQVAPFQGIDPPIALTPQAALVTTTSDRPPWSPGPEPSPTKSAVQHETAPSLMPVRPTPRPHPVKEEANSPGVPDKDDSDPLNPNEPSVPQDPVSGDNNDPGDPHSFNGEDPVSGDNSDFDDPSGSNGQGQLSNDQSGTRPEHSNPDVGQLNDSLNGERPRPSIVVGDQIITADQDSNFVVSGTTYTPGATLTMDDGSVITIPTPVPDVLEHLVFNGQTISPDQDVNYVVGEQTLSPGEVATVSGAIVTMPLPVGISGQTDLFTFDGTTYTRDENGALVIDSQTLTPGGSITVDGTVLSQATDGAQIVVGGSRTVDVGDLVMRPFETGLASSEDTGDGSAQSNPEIATGRGVNVMVDWRTVWMFVGVGAFLVSWI